jgi:hypothetical protein
LHDHDASDLKGDARGGLEVTSQKGCGNWSLHGGGF